jgi:glutathione S-transferase
VIIVHGFAPVPPLASPSPFCLKLETWLRMAGLPYEARADYAPFTSPKGKAPWVTLEDGASLSDSEHIVRALAARPDVTLDHGLTAADHARATVIRRTVEDHLYFALLQARWVRDDGFAILRNAYFETMAWPVRQVVPSLARRGVVKATWFQGVGRHSDQEVDAAAIEDLEALSVLLGDAPYFLGDAPRSLDATVYGALANVLWGPFPGPMQDAVRARPNLVAYCERIRDRWWA